MATSLPLRHSTVNNLRLETLIRVRWLAVAGQTAAVVIVAFVMDFEFNMPVCMAIIACSAWLNVFLGLRYRANLRLSSSGALALLGYDILQLAALLFATGGLQNPFAILLVVPVVISATTQSIRNTMLLGGLAIVCATLLVFNHWNLPWAEGETLKLPLTLVAGTWVAIVSSLAFTAAYAFRVADESRKLNDALSATELVLQREQHLSTLDGLAAAAAHELGTPLATIALVSKEMTRELPEESPFLEDAKLLRSQAERCREILKKLTSLSDQGDDHIGHLALTAMMEEVADPHRHFGIDVHLDFLRDSNEPVLQRNPGILYGLGNLIENAVDFARSEVVFTAEWDLEEVIITITDDGPGFPPELLDRIGEPFMTTRARSERGMGGGLGLGLFIAKTLLERSGASIEFSNRVRRKGGGAQIVISWRRERLQAPDKRIEFEGDPVRIGG